MIIFKFGGASMHGLASGCQRLLLRIQLVKGPLLFLVITCKLQVFIILTPIYE